MEDGDLTPLHLRGNVSAAVDGCHVDNAVTLRPLVAGNGDDGCQRVLHPDVPIRPGIVKVQTELTSAMGKTFLANSITLTPGTLTVDIIDQTLYVHWINIETDDPEAQTDKLVRRFERMLKEIFE